MYNTKDTSKVLLISMPWAHIEAPSIQLGILKRSLYSHAIHSDAEHLNLYFAAAIGLSFYHKFIYGFKSYKFWLLGEWLFNATLKEGEASPIDDGMHYLDHLNDRLMRQARLQGVQMNDEPLAACFGTTYREKLKYLKYVQIPEFKSQTLNRIDFSQYDTVAFTSSLNQAIPSLAMAKEIKQQHPNIIIIVGGTTFDGDMGPAYIKAFPFIDFCIRGEGENALPALINTLRNSKHCQDEDLKDIPGLCWRKMQPENIEEIRVNSTGTPIFNLNQSPIPDYSDFYSSIKSIKEEEGVEIEAPIIYFESSRGCWWRKCTFCTYGGRHANYRSKTSARVLHEILTLSSRHKCLSLCASDNVLSKNYFKELLPRLKEKECDISIWYQVRVDMTKQEIKMLSDAGINNVHAGIESFHSGLLNLMHKGTLAIENIQFLKWCYQYKIGVSYNILLGVPGEKAYYYEEMLQTMEKIKHLAPPSYPPNRLEIARFSPYYHNPENYGISRLRPMDDYRYIFPEDVELSEIALIFDPILLHKEGGDQLSFTQKVTEIIKEWRDAHHNEKKPMLRYAIGSEFVEIYDSRRNGEIKTTLLEALSSDIYLFCDNIQTIDQILNFVDEKYNKSHSHLDTERILLNFIDQNIMMCEDDKYLSLAVPLKGFPLESNHF